MLLSQAVAAIHLAPKAYYIRRLSWPEDHVVYIYKSLVAKLLNEKNHANVCNEKAMLVKCSLLNTFKQDYIATVDDIVASDWVAVDKYSLNKKYNLE